MSGLPVPQPFHLPPAASFSPPNTLLILPPSSSPILLETSPLPLPPPPAEHTNTRRSSNHAFDPPGPAGSAAGEGSLFDAESSPPSPLPVFSLSLLLRSGAAEVGFARAGGEPATHPLQPGVPLTVSYLLVPRAGGGESHSLSFHSPSLHSVRAVPFSAAGAAVRCVLSSPGAELTLLSCEGFSDLPPQPPPPASGPLAGYPGSAPLAISPPRAPSSSSHDFDLSTAMALSASLTSPRPAAAALSPLAPADIEALQTDIT